jgi:hypothetical protein
VKINLYRGHKLSLYFVIPVRRIGFEQQKARSRGVRVSGLFGIWWWFASSPHRMQPPTRWSRGDDGRDAGEKLSL